jgi:chromosome segregation ATPase
VDLTILNDKMNQLEEQVHRLVHEKEQLSSENKVLQQNLVQLRQRIADQERQFQATRKPRTQLSLDLDFNAVTPPEEIKKKLHEYIKELDKCIAILST